MSDTDCLKCGKPKCDVIKNFGECLWQSKGQPELCHGNCAPSDADAPPVHYHTFAGSMDRCERTDCDPAPTGGTALVSHRICDDCLKPMALDADAYCAGHGKEDAR